MNEERITYEEFMIMFKNAPRIAYTLYDKAEDEIERLNNDIKELLKENENKEKVIIAQGNIIKEVREYITTQKLHKIQDTTDGLTYQERKLLQILDKGE